ncbi:MAG: bacteriophage N4 adsorption protein A [Candidatus Thorarchaeota archaeon]|nr:bacteriophage N4 adsorption protein A [Candidatus Thorarchaeota archaeon]
MYVQTSMNAHQSLMISDHDYPWLAGAAYGLGARVSVPAEYVRYLQRDIRDLNIEPVRPGESYDLDDGVCSSAYDVLGGHVSVTGVIHPAGLLFPVPAPLQESVTELVRVAEVLDEEWMIVPKSEIERFMKLVPLKGPHAKRLMEVES